MGFSLRNSIKGGMVLLLLTMGCGDASEAGADDEVQTTPNGLVEVELYGQKVDIQNQCNLDESVLIGTYSIPDSNSQGSLAMFRKQDSLEVFVYPSWTTAIQSLENDGFQKDWPTYPPCSDESDAGF